MPDASFRLQVLGPVTVRASGDADAVSHVTQPRHLALLCYLALARPRGLHARDSIIALLWPKHDEMRGRRALRNALHGVRKLLGPEVIITAGDGLVGIDPKYLRCDALELEGHGERHGQAVSGDDREPFSGFHVAGSRAFSQWLSAERDRLAEALRRRVMTAADERHLVPRRPVAAAPAPVHGPDAYSLYIRGHFLWMRGTHGGAPDDLLRCREYFERALALDESYAPALAGLSNFFAVAARRELLKPFHENFAKAIDCSHRAHALDPSLAIPHVHFGVEALYLKDEVDRAGHEFGSAAAKDPSYAEGRRFYGVWLSLVNRHTEALHEIEAAAHMEPDIAHILSSLAAARLAVGDVTGAESAIRRTLELDPRHGPARDRLLRLFEEQQRYDEAIAERRRAPTIAGAEDFACAYEVEGDEGYRRLRREEIQRGIDALEARMAERHAVSVGDIFSPPVVRLVALYAQLGAWKKVRSWQLQATADRPALARWFASLPELRAMP